MKINVTRELMGVDGETPLNVTDEACPMCGRERESRPATLRLIGVNALSAMDPTQRITGEEKVKRFKLALRIQEHDELDLSVDELKLLKDLIGERYPPAFVFRAWAILDPSADE